MKNRTAKRSQNGIIKNGTPREGTATEKKRMPVLTYRWGESDTEWSPQLAHAWMDERANEIVDLLHKLAKDAPPEMHQHFSGPVLLAMELAGRIGSYVSQDWLGRNVGGRWVR